MTTDTRNQTLAPALARLAQLQRQSLDRLALQEAAQAAHASTQDAKAQIATITQHLQLPKARWHEQPDPAVLPLLMFDAECGWQVLTAQNGKGQWVAERWDASQQRWQEQVVELNAGQQRFAQINLRTPYRASDSPVLRMLLDELLGHRRVLLEAALGGLLIALISLATSLYSMQVYDRVIPTAASQTLLVLTLGIVMAIGFELLARRLRSHLYDHLIDRVDSQLARAIYLRFLGVRLDQLPHSVGSLAGQLRGFESVRSFLVQLATQFLIDAPFALVFVVVMAAIAGPIASIPLVFLMVSIGVGLWHKGQILDLSHKNQTLANQKTGLLVETVEAAEIVKSAQGGWRMLGRWLSSNDLARDNELAMRHISERAQHWAAALQQLAYVGVIAMGALMVSKGALSFGGLIACAILSGRVLAPVAQLSGQLVQWGHAKAALQGLDAIWKLEGDHHGVETPILPDLLHGHYQSDAARFSLHGKPIIDLANLAIQPGDKIAVLGPVGAGKTTLLRLLSGMYKPQQGRILLDGLDLAHIAKPWLAEQLGYLPQDGRLIEGTLRDNLLLGLTDPGDSVIVEAAQQTGLFDTVIKSHPQGLSQPIYEGGVGLSGGQRQLVNLTRVFLRRPKVWLLDEPTASLDRQSEVRVIEALHSALRAEDILVLVTHKPEMLSLVNRILVVAQGRVVMDGPRDAVLARLQAPALNPATSTTTEVNA
ncbi:ATP-binding cassette domain-containing protein [Aquabacterium sp.]|uniref:ATP-binding cassette domain-containing protein n=1 Tax=Aquabacterium sp. TaxID=1872578 RepID=UPI003CFF6FD3